MVQVTVEYMFQDGACRPLRVHTVVISTQHDETVTMAQLQDDLMQKVIKVVIPPHLMDNRTIFHLNPSGKFIIGGPMVRRNSLCTESSPFREDNSHLVFVYLLLGRRGTDRKEDHCRHVWWVGSSWGRSFLRQGLLKSRQERCLCRSMDCQVAGESWAV